MIVVGDTVKWTTSRKPLGVVIHIFYYQGDKFAVVESGPRVLKVVRVYEKLVKEVR